MHGFDIIVSFVVVIRVRLKKDYFVSQTKKINLSMYINTEVST